MDARVPRVLRHVDPAADVAVGHRLFNHRGAELLAVALMAMSPIAITVSRFATGDISADLFTLLALYALAVFSSRQKPRWMVLSAMAVGAGSACKYQAALAPARCRQGFANAL